MALIDIVKFQGNDEEFVWKFPSAQPTKVVLHDPSLPI
jgi:hypothetical protein